MAKPFEWTNPFNDDKFIIKDKGNGTHDFFYGPKDKMGKGIMVMHN